VRAWLRVFRAEWLRVATGRTVWLLPLAAGLGAAYAWGLGVAADRGLFGAPTGFYLAAAGAIGAGITCAAVGGLLAASAVGGDFASGVARTALCRPVSRSAWLGARIAALAGGVKLVFLAACLGALASGQLRFGLGAVKEGGYVLAAPGFLLGQLAVGVVVCIIGQVLAVCLGAMFGMLWGRSAPAVVSMAVLGAGLLALERWPELEALLPTTFLTAALDRVAQLAQGLATLHATDVAPRALGVFAGWLVATLVVGLPVLERKDIVS
jgi:ABC-2 type transport system permease protein